MDLGYQKFFLLRNKITFVIFHPIGFIRKYVRMLKRLWNEAFLALKKEGGKNAMVRTANYIFYGKGALSRRSAIEWRRKRRVLSKGRVNVTHEQFLRKNESAGYTCRENRIKVLFVSHDASLTGAPMELLYILKWLKRHAAVDAYLLLLGDGFLRGEFEKCCPTLLFDKNDFDKDVIFDFCNKPDLVYGNTVVAAKAYESLKDYGVPIITHVHELEKTIRECIGLSVLDVLKRYTTHFVASSEPVRKNLIESHGISSEKISLVNDFIEPSPSNIVNDKEKYALRHRLGIPKTSRVVLGCGNGIWRKGADLFVEVAREVLARSSDDVLFYWVGDLISDFGHDIDPNKMIKEYGISNKVFFVGNRKNFKDYSDAADVFLLTSREDPFPLVALNACESGLPVICFADAGGMPDFIGKGAGYVVPFEDVDAMAKNTISLLRDEELRRQIGDRSRSLLLENNVTDIAVPKLLAEMRRVSGIPHPISVIVPNYNYERYLDQRIRSIFDQSFRDFELLVLDDASTDSSVSVARKLLDETGIPARIIVNNQNQGCFVQWVNGIEMAKGSIVWIAEADDCCKPNFLETLIPSFLYRDVVLAYCQSEIIDERGEMVISSYHGYTDSLSGTKWKRDYINDGNREMNDGLAIKNTIPNASAVLMRKSALEGIGDTLPGFKFTGDWRTYAYVLKSGSLAYVKKILNSHRRHSASIIDRVEKSPAFFKELIEIQKAILIDFTLREDVYHSMSDYLQAEYARLGCSDEKEGSRISEHPDLRDALLNVEAIAQQNVLHQKNGPLTFVIVLPDLEFGGGQIVGIEQANFLSKTNRVILYNVRPNLRDELLVSRISPGVEIADSKGTPENFHEICRRVSPDVVLSHIWWSDKLVWQSIQEGNAGFKWILTMHGCYEMLVHNPSCDKSFDGIVVSVLEGADRVIYTADKNGEIFKRKKPNLRFPAMKINNGVVPKIPKKSDIRTRSDHDVEENAFVFFLCSRAIPEKGWGQAIEAFIRLKSDSGIKIPLHLFLIGASGYASELERKHALVKGLHFLGNRNDLHLLIPMFDACLLPSYFKSESQPMIIIDSLSQGKPVIATDIGEVSDMIGMNKAGLLVPLVKGKPDVDELVKCMKRFSLDEDDAYTEAKSNCPAMFEKFDMRHVAGRYMEIIDFLIK